MKEKGIGPTLCKILKNIIVKTLGREALKKVPNLYKKMSKKVENTKICKILGSDLANMLSEKNSQYAINKMQQKSFLSYLRIIE